MSTRRWKSVPIKPSQITPEHLYHSRRRFLKTAAVLGAGTLVAAACGPEQTPVAEVTKAATATTVPTQAATSTSTASPTVPPTVEAQVTPTSDPLANSLTSFDAVTQYNNYYEFTTSKEGVAKLAEDFVTSPWNLEVTGLVHNPKTFGLEDLQKLFPEEERIYRMRCVEGWSMIIPWLGFPLSRLLQEVEPMDSAQFVRFETILAPEQMPGQQGSRFPWPYLEGLRMDEAMHDLTILSTGLYGKALLPQNGAPLRLVVPWKYGFKSIKSIVKIELVDAAPPTFWNSLGPNEYGFYSNVNPEVPHPRWSQASERLIGEKGRQPTLMFNGYAEEVAQLYEGMDLKVYY